MDEAIFIWVDFLIKNHLTKSHMQSPITWAGLLFFSLPQTVTVFMFAAFPVLQGIYTKYFGVSLVAMAGIILFSRIVDAITDPVIGYWSDWQKRRGGARKPFMVIGALLYVVSGYFLYVPPLGVHLAYVYCFFTLFIIGYTLFSVSHIAWAGELAASSSEKTRIYSVRSAAGYVGLILFYTIPLLPIFSSNDITPETLQWCAIASVVFMIPVIVLAVKQVPNGCYSDPKVRHGSDKVSAEKSLKHNIRSFYKNKPFLLFLVVKIFVSTSLGMWYGLIFIYVDIYLGMGDQFAKMFFIAYILGLAFSPVWYKLSLFYGKRVAITMATALLLIAIVYTAALSPGQVSFAQLVLIKLLGTIGMGGFWILAPSILSDIADYSEWKFNVQLSATFFSVYLFLSKTLGGIGAAASLYLVGYFGFDAESTVQTTTAVYGLRLAMTWIPATFMLGAFVFIAMLPITAARHDVIRRRLASTNR